MVSNSAKSLIRRVKWKETKLFKIKVLIDGEVFAEFEVTPQQGGTFITVVKNYLNEPDWKRW